MVHGARQFAVGNNFVFGGVLMAKVPGTESLLTAAAAHLVRRFTYGYNSQLGTELLRYPNAEAWFEAQLTKPSDPDADAALSWFPRLSDSAATAWANHRADTYGSWQYGQDFAMYSIARRVLAKNQVHEMMVDFWSNLLHIPISEDASFPWRMDYDAKAIRPHALGTFRELLNAAITHPAMSGYLTNYRNTATKINENLGRELLELYTVGRPARYTEDDVKNSARLLTGFTVAVFDGYAAGYDPNRHYVGPVTVLGVGFANSAKDGRAELKNYLDWLARRPETAERIAHRLCVRFVSDEPPRSVVDAVKQAYLANDTDIKASLRALIGHEAFKSSVMKKARTPVEDVIAADRACDIVLTGAGKDSRVSSLAWFCHWTGQTPFSWPRPDGFPEKSDTYLSPARMLRSWTIHTWTASPSNALEKATRPPVRQLLPPVWPLPLADLVHHQSVMMTGRRAPADTVEAAATMIDKPSTHTFSQTWEREVDYMNWMLSLIRGVILNAPEAMLR